ncbi:PilZ domain-containing protein [Alcanivorax sediminis]|uniref:PilZ domain-containing protein n=1 Tax=Alcanivorax sediminis TaxID=2663008 RepID=UPI001F1736E6|nr:PilZ domain-containing protein [Alcanivorax sediminis]
MDNRESRGANRRKLARINTQMRVDVFRHRLFGGWRFVTRAKALDYNRFGIGLTSPMRLSPGTHIKLDLYSPSMILRQVEAEVVSCHRAGQAYRLGLRTYHTLKEVAGEVDQHQIRYLAGMEDVLPNQT